MDRDRPGPGGGAGNRDELGTRLIGSWVKVAKAPGVHEDVPGISWRQSSSVTAPDGWLCARTMAAAWSESAGAKTARRNRQMHEVTAGHSHWFVTKGALTEHEDTSLWV